MTKKSAAFIATEKLLIAIRNGKNIPVASNQDDVRAVARLIGYCEKRVRVGAVKEVRAMAQCGLKEALDLYDKYFRGMR